MVIKSLHTRFLLSGCLIVLTTVACGALAAWTLYQIEDPDAVPALRAALESEQNKEVQVAEIRALAALGEQSVDALRGLLESPDPKVKSMAVHALAGGQAAGPWPWPWPEPRPFP